MYATFTSYVSNFYHKHLKKDVIILFGGNGVFIKTFDKKSVSQEIFVDFSGNFMDKIEVFLKSLQNYHVYFVLDIDNIDIKHEVIPILQSLVKTHPIEHFISDHYGQDQLVSYSVQEQKEDEKMLHTTIASCHVNESLLLLLKYGLKNDFKFSGLYFLTLELPKIIDKILLSNLDVDLVSATEDLVHVFVTITKSSGIKIIVKRHNDIKSIKNIKIPEDKSVNYIHGMLEQNVSDTLLYLKVYLNQIKHSEVLVVFMLDSDMKSLIQQSSFTNCRIVYLDHQVLTTDVKNNNYGEFSYADSVLVQAFNQRHYYPAINGDFRDAQKFTFTNSFIFKPLYLILLCMLGMLLVHSLRYFLMQNKMHTIANEYYALGQQYRALRAKNEINPNMTNIIDLYDLNELDLVSSSPIQIYEEFINFVKSRMINDDVQVVLQIFDWSNMHTTKDRDHAIDDHSMINARILFDYVAKYETKTSALQQLENLLKEFCNQSKYKGVKYQISNEVFYIKNTIMKIPVIISFDEKNVNIANSKS